MSGSQYQRGPKRSTRMIRRSPGSKLDPGAIDGPGRIDAPGPVEEPGLALEPLIAQPATSRPAMTIDSHREERWSVFMGARRPDPVSGSKQLVPGSVEGEVVGALVPTRALLLELHEDVVQEA